MIVEKEIVKKYNIVKVAIDFFDASKSSIFDILTKKSKYCFSCGKKFVFGEKISLVLFVKNKNRLTCNSCASICEKEGVEIFRRKGN